ncbi:hypothetical protein ACEWY4_026407 [Coilia grayii]|uniref:G-protein coupled receptors family 1 profile domain-containing protein n=1 Tax=Coilia grayii TaxID=363190 RepID=A0ABD1IUS5_9TELE
METNGSSNITVLTNQTEDFDIYCRRFMAGPLVWTVFSTLCGCVGLPASVGLLWVLVQRQRIGLTSDIYMVNLTPMELIYNIFRPLSVLNFSVLHDEVVKEISLFVEGFQLNGRPLLMACICVDCHMAVAHPITYLNMKNSRCRLAVCALVWATTLTLNLFGRERQHLHLAIRGLLRLLIVSVITYCDVAILLALRKPDPAGKTDIHPQKRRALQVIINSLVMTVVSYLPQVLVSIASTLVPLGQQAMWVSDMAVKLGSFLGFGSL